MCSFITLACLCSWADWFEIYLVGNPEDRFSRDEAQMVTFSCQGVVKVLDFFAQFGSYHLICSNKQLITGAMKFHDDSTAGGNKTP